jgi:hypothetical protein
MIGATSEPEMDGTDPACLTPHVEADVRGASVELRDLTRVLILALRERDQSADDGNRQDTREGSESSRCKRSGSGGLIRQADGGGKTEPTAEGGTRKDHGICAVRQESGLIRHPLDLLQVNIAEAEGASIAGITADPDRSLAQSARVNWSANSMRCDDETRLLTNVDLARDPFNGLRGRGKILASNVGPES